MTTSRSEFEKEEIIQRRSIHRTDRNKYLTPRQKKQTIWNLEYVSEKHKQEVLKILNNRDKWMFVFGNPGTGKGHVMAIYYKKKVIKQRIYPIWINAFQMFMEIKTDFLNAPEMIETYKKCDCLIIDELEKIWGNDRMVERDILFDIINHRYEHYKQTIFISNWDWESIKEKFGIPLTDRFAEMGFSVNFNWESYRPKKKVLNV